MYVRFFLFSKKRGEGGTGAQSAPPSYSLHALRRPVVDLAALDPGLEHLHLAHGLPQEGVAVHHDERGRTPVNQGGVQRGADHVRRLDALWPLPIDRLAEGLEDPVARDRPVGPEGPAEPLLAEGVVRVDDPQDILA